MHRSFAWVMIAILALMLALFAGVPGVPASVAQADTTAPTDAPLDDEVIVITSPEGQLRVDDPTTPPGYEKVTWSSASVLGWESGWTVVAAGDFNGDGDAELVAARSITTGNPAGSYIKVFDPVVQPGSTLVDFSANLTLDAPVGVMRSVKLLVTGDFDNDGRDEFAFVNYLRGTDPSGAAVQVYDNDVTLGWVRLTNDDGYGVMFQDMGVGDFNADSRDDLVLVRNGDRQVFVMNISPWQAIATEKQITATDWYAAAGGNISTDVSAPGDEIVMLRDSGLGGTYNVMMFRVVSGKLSQWPTPIPFWNFNPSFVSISNGDLNGDGDDETVLLRDGAGAIDGISLYSLNPVGAPVTQVRLATGTGANLFKIVRTGDTDGDGLDEIVILRGNLYRIYTEPNVDARNTETPGAFYTSGGVSNLPFLAVANVDGPGIAEGPVLSVTPASLSFSLDCGVASPIKPLSITNSGTGSNFAWRAETIEANGSGWLLIDAPSGTTPGTVNVSVRPGIAQGNYTGTVQVTTDDPAVQLKTVNIPVTYAALCSGFSVSPGTLNFNVPWGSTGTQSLAIGGPGPTAWNSTVSPVPPTSSCSWLTLSATTGTTPVTVNVSANAATAGVGSKQCSILFAADTVGVPGSPQYVTVNLTVADPGFVVTPTDITIRQAIVDYPTTVKRYVKIERPKQVTNWTATALEGIAATELDEKLANGQASITDDGLVIDGVLAPSLTWLEFTPPAGQTPATMMVSVKADTAAGTYHGRIFIVATGFPTQEVSVTAMVANNFYFTFLPLVLQ